MKVIGHGVINGLPGLAAMRPGGDFLTGLNREGNAGSEYYAITADFEPKAQKFASLVSMGAADALMDRVFRDAENDLVVPTSSVFEVEGCAGFPVPAERVLRFDARAGVIHTTYFRAPETARALANWLQPEVATERTGGSLG